MFSSFDPANITVDDISATFSTDVQVSVLRLDKLHPVVSGNKWFKLRYYFEEAKKQGKKTIITFGGAWSNHIIATAAACRFHDLRSIGIIRGEKSARPSTTLLQAEEWGMKLVFSPRHIYREQYIPPEFLTDENYIIPEGGYGVPGAAGAATILDFCSKDFTHYCCAVGTTTMMAGLVNSILSSQQVIGISVLKNNVGLEEKLKTLVLPSRNKEQHWQLLHNYHFGGYARYQPDLLNFMNDFYHHTNIPSDFVYTGKLFYAISDLIRKNFFKPRSRILMVHSGGLQGNMSLRKGTLMF